MRDDPLTRCYTIDECWNAATGISASALDGLTSSEVVSKLTIVFGELLADSGFGNGDEAWTHEYVDDMIQADDEY